MFTHREEVHEDVHHPSTRARLLRSGLIAIVCGFCVMTLPAQAQWHDADLTAITGGPIANGPIAIAYDPLWNGMRTHYVGWDGHVHELFLTPQ